MSAEPTSDWVFVARQPILDAAKRVFAYELLFRSSGTELVAETAGDQATTRVIADALLDFGLDHLAQERLAFISVTRQLLVERVPRILPANRIVVQLLEDVAPDAEVMEACQELRAAGYTLALDEFTLDDRAAGLLPLVKFVKVDILENDGSRARLIQTKVNGQADLLAEKVETVEQFERSQREGFRYFQGFFFGRPQIQTTRTIPTHQLHHLRILNELHAHELTVAELEELIRHDATLCYRVLRMANSAACAQRQPVQSVRQAIVLLGVDTIRRWLSVWLLGSLGDGAHPELGAMATIRARCCELIGAALFGREAASEAFLLGMCSLLDAILQRPMDAILAQVPLSERAKRALGGDDNANRRMLDCVIAHERGDWDRCLYLAGRMGIEPTNVDAAHKEALKWANAFQTAA
jgi:c-di-GMP-related signal transduction protein